MTIKYADDKVLSHRSAGLVETNKTLNTQKSIQVDMSYLLKAENSKALSKALAKAA